MKNFTLGLIVGILLTSGVAYAASRVVLVNGGGTEIGTASNPIIITGV